MLQYSKQIKTVSRVSAIHDPTQNSCCYCFYLFNVRGTELFFLQSRLLVPMIHFRAQKYYRQHPLSA